MRQPLAGILSALAGVLVVLGVLMIVNRPSTKELLTSSAAHHKEAEPTSRPVQESAALDTLISIGNELIKDGRNLCYGAAMAKGVDPVLACD